MLGEKILIDMQIKNCFCSLFDYFCGQIGFLWNSRILIVKLCWNTEKLEKFLLLYFTNSQIMLSLNQSAKSCKRNFKAEIKYYKEKLSRQLNMHRKIIWKCQSTFLWYSFNNFFCCKFLLKEDFSPETGL